MRCFSFVVTMAAALLFFGENYAQTTSSWPIYRSDSGLSGAAKVEGPIIPDLYWVKSIGLEKIQSPVVSADGTIVFTSRGDEFVYALRTDGAEKWRFSYKLPGGKNETFSAPPTLGSDGTVYVGSHEGSFFAINPNGSLKWRAKLGGYVGTAANIGKDGNLYLACDDAELYVFNPAGSLLCVGSLDGEKPGNTPAIVSFSQVYVPAGNSIFVFNSSCSRIARWILPTLGEVAWVASNANGKVLYAGSRSNPLVIALDTQTGKQIWNYSYNSRYGPPSQPALGPDGTIYFAGFDAGLLVALQANGKEKWTRDQGSARYKTMPVVDASGDIYIVNETLGLAAFAPNKTLLWNLPNVQCKYAPAFGPDGTIYVPSLKKLYAVRPQPPYAVTLELVSGNGQAGCIDSVLANSIQARVRDQYGKPFGGQPVRFRAIIGGGQPQDTTVNTSPDGIAKIEWQLGSKLDEQQLEISSRRNEQHLSGSPIIVFANAVGPKIAGASAVAFSRAEVRDSSDTTYTIFNRSDCILTIDRLEFSDSTTFSEIPPRTRNALIPPQGSLVVRLRFTPKDSGSHSGTLFIYSNDTTQNPFNVALRGEAFTKPKIIVEPLSLDFEEIKVGDDSMQTIKISNVGTALLVVSSFIFSDSAYSTDRRPPVTIAPSSSVVVPITFTPTEARQYPATLKIASNDAANNPVIVALDGRGTLAPDIHVAPNPLVLVACNDSIATGNVTISNRGNAILHVTSLKSDNPAFTFDTTSFDLPPGVSKIIRVSFSPKAVMADSGFMSIFSNDPNENPFAVKLRGEVKGPEIILIAKHSLLELCRGQSATVEVCIKNPSDCILRVDSLEYIFIFPPGVAKHAGRPQKENAVFNFPQFILPGDSLCFPPHKFIGTPVDFEIIVRARSNGIPDPDTLRIPVKIKPPVIAAVDTVDFGNVTVGETKTLLDSAKVWSVQCQVRIDSARITGLDKLAFKLEPKLTYPITLNEGDTVSIPVAFNPKDKGPHTALLEVFSNDPKHGLTNPIKIVLIGNGALKQPDIEVSPKSIAFGPACTDSLLIPVTVSNVGDTTLHVTKLDFTNLAFSTTHAGSFDLAPQASTTIWVSYTQTSAKIDTGSLLIYSNDPDSSEKIVVVKLHGETKPEIEVKPAAINFGAVCVDSAIAVKVFNAGKDTLRVKDLDFSNKAFSTTHDSAFAIAPCDSEIVWVRFSPTAGKADSGSLAIHSNDADEPIALVELKGEGGASKIAGSPSPVEFPIVNIRECDTGLQDSSAATYEIRNPGTCDLVISSFRVDGDFAIAPIAVPLTIPKDGAVSVKLYFKPKAKGASKGALHVFSNALSEPEHIVELKGTALATPQIAAKPDTLNFGQVPVNTSADSAVMVMNIGGDTLRVTNIAVTGTVFAPNGTLPLYNVNVYVPREDPGAFTPGVQCSRCSDDLPGSPVARAITDEAGNFRLENVPTGDNIPLVITIGKWRRKIIIPRVESCVEQSIGAGEARLPKNKAE
ncbi:MAG: choice-of-anchor D domain-containing protein, partial [candidate division KSB1 bacterium]